MIEIQQPNQRTIQTKEEVMANTSSVPQKFYLAGSRKNTLITHVTGKAPEGMQIPGSIVSNRLKPGSFGLVAALPTDTTSNNQKLINTIQSNN